MLRRSVSQVYPPLYIGTTPIPFLWEQTKADQAALFSIVAEAPGQSYKSFGWPSLSSNLLEPAWSCIPHGYGDLNSHAYETSGLSFCATSKQPTCSGNGPSALFDGIETYLADTINASPVISSHSDLTTVDGATFRRPLQSSTEERAVQDCAFSSNRDYLQRQKTTGSTTTCRHEQLDPEVL
jgi:hypothetical protein